MLSRFSSRCEGVEAALLFAVVVLTWMVFRMKRGAGEMVLDPDEAGSAVDHVLAVTD